MEQRTSGLDRKKEFWVWGAFSGFLIVALVFGFLSFPDSSGAAPMRAHIVQTEPMLSYDDLPTLYAEFACPCCGQDIGSCGCGLAENMRVDVRQRIDGGKTRNQLNMGMYSTYGSGVFFDQELAASARADLEATLPKDRPILISDQILVDLGRVALGEAPFEASFTLRNTGLSDLTITGLETSCGCTTAVLRIGDKLSPVFGMAHAQNGGAWSAVLPPGGEAHVHVTMDPFFHGEPMVGKIGRTISVLSGDPLQSKFELSLRLEVTE